WPRDWSSDVCSSDLTEHSQQHLRCLCREGLVLNVRVALYQPDVAREIALQCVDEGLIRRRIVKSLSRDSIAVESTVWYEKNSVEIGRASLRVRVDC